LKIGAVIDMRQARGLQDKKWFDLFAKLHNDEGGWKIGNDTYQVQMITYDSQGNVTTAKDLLTRLVLQDGCKFIIGQISTGSAEVDCTITEPNKVITIHNDLTNLGADPKYQYFYTTGNFFTGALSPQIAANMAKVGIKNYVSVKPDNQVGRSMDPSINAAWVMGAPNVKYLGTVWVAPTTIDYAPIATKVKSYNTDCVDLIYLGYLPNSVPQMYRALYDVGFKGLILPGLMSQADLDALVVQVGKAAVEGGMQSSMGLDPRTYKSTPRILYLTDAYVKEYGKFETDGIRDADQFSILEAVFNATQSVDTDVIKNYLDNKPPPIETLNGFTTLVARPDIGNYRTNVTSGSGPIGLISNGKVIAGPISACKDNYLATIMSMKLGDVYKAYWLKYGYPTWPASEKGMEVFHYTDLGITGQD
jgi:branched-chain amino acid transport system substrate-binding protein